MISAVKKDANDDAAQITGEKDSQCPIQHCPRQGIELCSYHLLSQKISLRPKFQLSENCKFWLRALEQLSLCLERGTLCLTKLWLYSYDAFAHSFMSYRCDSILNAEF